MWNITHLDLQYQTSGGAATCFCINGAEKLIHQDMSEAAMRAHVLKASRPIGDA